MTELKPSLEEIKNRLYIAFQATEDGSDYPEFVDSKITSRALAGLFYDLYLKNKMTAKNIFADQADDRTILNHARLKAKERTSASEATGPVFFKIEQNGVSVDQDLLLQDIDGNKYRVTENKKLSNPDGLDSFVKAVEPGKMYNNPPGTILTPVRSQPGLRSATVTGEGITGGKDIGTLEDLRLDVIRSFQSYEGRGGNNDDWLKWLREIPSSFRSFYFPRFGGAGSVGYAFVVKNSKDIIALPNQIQIDEAKSLLSGKKPSTVALQLAAINLIPVVFSVEANFTREQEHDVVSNLKQLFLNDAHVGAAFGDSTGKISKNNMLETILTASGTSDFSLIAPADDLEPGRLEIFKFGELRITQRNLEENQ